MRGVTRVLAMVCSLGLASSALAQESRTFGRRQVAVGDVVHRTQEMSMDADATMSIDNVTSAPMVMKMQTSDIFDLKIEALRVPNDPKGALYRVEVLRLEEVVPMQGAKVSSLVGRTLVVDMAKRKVKPASGAKLTSDELDELFKTLTTLGNPFISGTARAEGQAPPTYTVGQHVDPADFGGSLPSDMPEEMSVVVQGFESGPNGERAIFAISMGGTVVSDGQPMDIHMSGTMQFDVATGWPLGADLHGALSVDDAAVSTDTMNMHISMKGPMVLRMDADFTTADGRSFGYIAE